MIGIEGPKRTADMQIEEAKTLFYWYARNESTRAILSNEGNEMKNMLFSPRQLIEQIFISVLGICTQEEWTEFIDHYNK
jgi:hypothetical protein